MSIAHFAIVGASTTLLVLFCVALQDRPQRRRSAKNSDPLHVDDDSVAKITSAASPGSPGTGDVPTLLEQQLRETLRRVQAGEPLAELSREACAGARVQVANDSAHAKAWVGRVSEAVERADRETSDATCDVREVQPWRR